MSQVQPRAAFCRNIAVRRFGLKPRQGDVNALRGSQQSLY